MIWLTWRQHRAELAGALLLLAALGVLLWWSGLAIRADFQAQGLAGCVSDLGSPGCGDRMNRLIVNHEDMANIISSLNMLPVLAGVFVGAPLLARELDRGTWRLAWTQSVTRTRWLTVKLLLVGGSVIVLAAGFTALLTWWREPLDALEGRFSPTAFNFEGLIPVSVSLFAFGLGTLAGVLNRRLLPAMAVAVVGFFPVRLTIEFLLRPRYREPMVRTGDAAGASGAKDWVLGEGLIDQHGSRLSKSEEIDVYNSATQADLDSILRERGLTWVEEYHPADRFWEFQLIEASIYVGLVVVLLALTLWLVRRRTT